MTIEEAIENKINKVTDNVLNNTDKMLEDDQRRSPMSVPEIREQRVLLQKLIAMQKQFSNVQTNNHTA